MVFVERKLWILAFKAGYTFLQDDLYILNKMKISNESIEIQKKFKN